METDHRALGFEHSMDLGLCFLLAVRVVMYPTPAPGHKVLERWMDEFDESMDALTQMYNRVSVWI